ncbi:hypothetical protein HDU97_005518 [Phlyctochytrium planicorne]|nr:hypothetical protein HDU97_005518 [Phlyctochytrium planicorne]
MKSQLDQTLDDFMLFGCLRGFKYFESYLRGREELILRVYNDRKTPAASRSQQANSIELAKEFGKLSVTTKSQRLLMLSAGSGLPPASPCDRELERDDSMTAFLVAAYARYKRPFVWLRSHHRRLVRHQENQELETDMPLKLDATNQWAEGRDIKLFQIVAEVLVLVLLPQPSNPFMVNHKFFDSLPVEESLISTGAMIEFLQNVLTHDVPYASEVFEDLRQLQSRYWKDMHDVASRTG